jgi:hypothetical protein
MPAFFPDSMWRRVIKPRISNITIPMAMPGIGTAVEVVSKVNGSDVPEIWAVAPTEKNTSITMPVKMCVRLFIVKGFKLRKTEIIWIR